MNHGASKLDGMKLKQIAVVRALKALGVTVNQSSVSQWQTGKKRPAPKARGAMLTAFGIEVTAWDTEGPIAPAPAPSGESLAGPKGWEGQVGEMPHPSDLAKDALVAVQILQEQLESSKLTIDARKMLATMLGESDKKEGDDKPAPRDEEKKEEEAKAAE